MINRRNFYSGSNRGLNLTGWSYLTGQNHIDPLVGHVGRIFWNTNYTNNTTIVTTQIDGQTILETIVEKVIDKWYIYGHIFSESTIEIYSQAINIPRLSVAGMVLPDIDETFTQEFTRSGFETDQKSITILHTFSIPEFRRMQGRGGVQRHFGRLYGTNIAGLEKQLFWSYSNTDNYLGIQTSSGSTTNSVTTQSNTALQINELNYEEDYLFVLRCRAPTNNYDAGPFLYSSIYEWVDGKLSHLQTFTY